MKKEAPKAREMAVAEPPVGVARLPEIGFWTLAFLLVAGLRLPYLTSPNFILDGDESLLGVMAKHLSEGRGFPIFPYGQAYGFSLIETLPAAIGFRLFGPEPVVLTVSMLALFFLGLAFYERAFFGLTGDREWSRGLTLILAVLPVWIVWSVKARGGYLSAFVLLGAVLWIFARDRIDTRRAALGGGILGLLAHAQAFWLPGALPLLLLPLTRGKHPRYLVPVSASAITVAVGLYLLGGEGEAYWTPTVFGALQPAHLASLPIHLHRLFSGYFYLEDIATPPLLVSSVAWLLTAGFFVLLLASGRAFIRHRDKGSLLMAISLLAAVSFLPVLRTVPPRYLLSVSVLVVTAQALWLARRSSPSRTLPRLCGNSLLLLLCLSAFQMTEFRPIFPDTSSDLKNELHGLIDFFEANEVEGVYSVNGLLQWQIMFYGDEKIPARYASPTDRYPPFPAKVDSILADGGKTALVGPMSAADLYAQTPLAEVMVRVGQDYFVVPGPSRTLLEWIGFKFKD
ncbi:MAG: hypothetical protein ABIF09_02125 [Gemmatimonadota bacterium]